MQFSDRLSLSVLNAFSWALSKLPEKMLYLLSDLTFFITYHLVRYRRKVVERNIAKSYPDLDEKQRRNISKGFYHFFCDYFFESMMIVHLKPERLDKMMKYTNPEILEPFYATGKGVILVAGHYGNWELTAKMPDYIKHKVLVVYKPQSNKGIDEFFIRFRAKYGMEAVPMSGIAKKLAYAIRDKIPTLTYLLSDQRPDRLNVRYWTSFLRQETPVILGPEKLSQKYKQPVFFIDLKRIKRGHYEASFVLIDDQPETRAEFEVTEKHVRYLESMIDRDPTLWLWSHNRWKHRRFADFLDMMQRFPDSPGVSYNPKYIKAPETKKIHDEI